MLDTLDYPIMWIFVPAVGKRIVGVCRKLDEVRDMPLENYRTGHPKNSLYITTEGKVMRPCNVRVAGIGWSIFREIGWVTKFIVVIFSVFSMFGELPLRIHFELEETGEEMTLDDVRKAVKRTFKDSPHTYFTYRSEQKIRRAVNSAQSLAALAEALLPSG